MTSNGTEHFRMVLSGRNGYVASALKQYLFEAGFDVVTADSGKWNLSEEREAKAFWSTVSEDETPISVVFLSAKSRLDGDTFELFSRNCSIADNFIKFAPVSRLRSVISISSIDVYGLHPVLPISERTMVSPGSFYGLSKAAAEGIAKLHLQEKVPLTLLRVPGLYGRATADRSIVGTFAAAIAEGSQLRLNAYGEVQRDFLHVRDLCEAIRMVLLGPMPMILNLASGFPLTILEWVETLSMSMGKPANLKLIPDRNARDFDIKFDLTLMRELLPGFNPRSPREGCLDYRLL